MAPNSCRGISSQKKKSESNGNAVLYLQDDDKEKEKFHSYLIGGGSIGGERSVFS